MPTNITSKCIHQTSVTLTQFAVTEAFLLRLAPEGPDPSQFGLLVVCVLSEPQQSLLFGHLLLLQLLILQLQVPESLLLQQPTRRISRSSHTAAATLGMPVWSCTPECQEVKV